jgi:H+/gluconate symporter-like permease
VDVLVCLFALALLIVLAYRGFSVILVAPFAAMLAVLLTEPAAVAPAYSGLFMDKLATFVRLYFPVFLLGACFGKLIEVSGVAESLVSRISRFLGARHAIVAIAAVGMILTYGGVSVFVVVFATYPFAAEMFRRANIPKRLVPATIALSAFTVTMDALPGTPQIQNIIPTTFFKTDAYAAPILGVFAAVFTTALCLLYLYWQSRRAATRGEGYGDNHRNEPEVASEPHEIPIWLALTPLAIVGVANRIILVAIEKTYTAGSATWSPSATVTITQNVKANAALWSVEVALLLGILATAAIGWATIRKKFAAAGQTAVGGALLAAMNTASEYGFGAVIAALPGFHQVAAALSGIRDPLVNASLTTTVLCGITGSASGGLSLTLGAFADRFSASAAAYGIPPEVMHRITALASGGMDTLPHNGAIITLLAVTGLTHREGYKDIFVITVIKTLAVFFAIALFYTTGWI